VNSRKRYERVLRVVNLQNTPKQLPGVTMSTLKVILAAHGPYEGEDIGASVRRAVEMEALVRWTDEDGNIRYTLATEDDLQRAARYCGERGLTEETGRLNTALSEVRHG